MTAVFAARILVAITLTLAGSSCVFHSNPIITSEPDSAELKNRFARQLRDLEYATGKRYRGRTIHIDSPIPAIYRDWRLMPVAKIRGRRQGGLTSWRAAPQHTTISLAAWRGNTPEWLIRHEALHTVLLSNNVTGHPSRYAELFSKSYWWMPESYYRDKANSKNSAGKLPRVNTASCEAWRDGESAITAACCPICGIGYANLPPGGGARLTSGSAEGTRTAPGR